MLTYLLLSLGFTVMAQEKYTIRGTVKDNENGETLIGASIYLQGTGYGTITNEYGFYSLTAPAGTYTLSITYIGYEETTQQITLNSDQTVDLELSPNATALDEIVVSADDTEKINLTEHYTQLVKNIGTPLKIMTLIALTLILYGYLARALNIFFFWESKSIGFGLTVQYTGILFLTLILLFNYYLEFFNKNLYPLAFVLLGIVCIFPFMAIDYRPYRSLLLIVLALFGFLSSVIIQKLKKKKG